MKKILSALIVTAVFAGLSSAAHAAGSDPGFTATTGFDSEHTGSVDATCSLDVLDGALPLNAGFTNSLTSSTLGKISTVCNSDGSKLVVSLGVGSAPTQAGYTEEYKLDNGGGAYTGVSTGFVSAPTTINDLSNSYLAAASNVDVTARASVPTGYNLAAGGYTINVTATVTP
jgi:hypothetical protein